MRSGSSGVNGPSLDTRLGTIGSTGGEAGCVPGSKRNDPRRDILKGSSLKSNTSLLGELALRAIARQAPPWDPLDTHPAGAQADIRPGVLESGGGVPRTKEFKPGEALDRAMELFWRHGYSGTALDALVRRTRASRYGLYATFGGKRDLFLGALERYSQVVMDPMIGELEDPGASASEIRGFFDRVLALIRRYADRRGCFMCNAAFERGAVDLWAAKRTQQHFDRVRRLLPRALTHARRDGTVSR